MWKGLCATSGISASGKQAEEEQRALIDELVRRNRDLQQFSYITSHNLRAPVANMIGLMSLYNKENPCDPNNVVLIENVEWSINQLNGTLSDLVRIIVIKNNVNIEQESLALEAVYQTVYQSIEQTVLESQAQIKVDFSQVPQLVYNRIHLESIFLNLLTNAIRYRSPDRPLEIGITSQHRGGYVEIDFADNGLGIDLARYQERLFGLYQRFHNHPESKGLGLYIVKSEVTALGGRIEVESEVGKGTTFKVFLKTHYNDYPSGSITRG
jgi:signal transduction histidine kinase